MTIFSTRLLAALSLLAMPFAASAQDTLPPAAPPPAEAPALAETPAPRTERVTLATTEGPILLEIEVERAPETAANFLRYVREGRLDGTAFYRATVLGQGYGLIQGGTKGDRDKVLPPVAHEPTSETGLTHMDGAISMAMGEPGTADGDFFIIVGSLPSLDATETAPGFAAFGRVVEGMETVRTILAAPTDPNEGEGVMKGQYLADPVTITRAERVDTAS